MYLILGLPNAGGGKPLGIDEVVAANNLRAELGLSKEEFGVAALQDRLRKGFDDDLSIRSFFLILFNRLLFPTASWGITNHEVLLTEKWNVSTRWTGASSYSMTYVKRPRSGILGALPMFLQPFTDVPSSFL